MKDSSLKQKLSRGEVVFGPFWKTRDQALIEAAASAGFDFVILDLEHASHAFSDIESLVRVAELAGIGAVVRTPDHRESDIVKALDSGAQGILVPHVSTRAEAQQVVAAAKFQPLGERGMDVYARSARYGVIPKSEYLQEANNSTVVAIQIEGQEGVANVKEIVAVPGIDVVFFGPYDLSQSMGIPGQVDHPDLVAKLKELVDITRSARKAAGIYVDDSATALRWAQLGIQFISISVDVRLFYQACRQLVAALREG